jgi:putative protease
MAQLDAVMAHLVPQLDTIYLDSMLFAGDQQEIGSRITQLQAHGLRCFLNAAPVLRTRELAFYQREWMQDLLGQLDGVLVHTMDELAWFRDFFEKHHPSAVVAGDDSLYAYNSVASAYLTELGVRRQTLPAELNSRELAAFDRPGSELNLYGYQPLMHSAQCVVRNTKGCTGKPEILHLKDRKGICFPVWNRCPFCCNTIYNSVPLQLGGCRSEVAALAPDYLRLSFTVEDREETERILLAYVQIFFGDGVCTTDLTGTKGHFKRGVE